MDIKKFLINKIVLLVIPFAMSAILGCSGYIINYDNSCDLEHIKDYVGANKGNPNRVIWQAIDLTLLMRAAECGNVRLVSYLIHNGADVNWVGKKTGRTPLSMAVHCQDRINRYLVVKLLLKNGARCNVHENETGYTPFLVACLKEDLDVTRLLLKHGANPREVSNLSQSALMDAAAGGSVEVLQFLLGLGLDINHINYAHETALILAAKYGKLETARLLLQNNADVTVETIGGLTAYSMAIKHNYTDIAELIQSHSNSQK